MSVSSCLRSIQELCWRALYLIEGLGFQTLFPQMAQPSALKAIMNLIGEMVLKMQKVLYVFKSNHEILLSEGYIAARAGS